MTTLTQVQIRQISEGSNKIESLSRQSRLVADVMEELSASEAQAEREEARIRRDEDWSILATLIVGRELPSTSAA